MQVKIFHDYAPDNLEAKINAFIKDKNAIAIQPDESNHVKISNNDNETTRTNLDIGYIVLYEEQTKPPTAKTAPNEQQPYQFSTLELTHMCPSPLTPLPSEHYKTHEIIDDKHHYTITLNDEATTQIPHITEFLTNLYHMINETRWAQKRLPLTIKRLHLRVELVHDTLTIKFLKADNQPTEAST